MTEFKTLENWTNESSNRKRGSGINTISSISSSLEDAQAEAIIKKHTTRSGNISYTGINKEIDSIKDEQKREAIAQDVYSASIGVIANSISIVMSRLINNVFDRTKKKETKKEIKTKEAQILIDKQIRDLNQNINSLELDLREAKKKFNAADIIVTTITDNKKRKAAKKIRQAEQDRINALEKRLKQAYVGNLSI